MKLPAPSPRTLAALAWATGLGALGLVLWLLAELSQTNARFDDGAADRRDLRSQLVQQQNAATALADQVVELGEEPVVDPADPPPATVTLLQGERGLIGPQGPAGKQGPPGKDGAPGQPGADGVGKDGEDGTDGTDGASIVGPQGEPGQPGTPGAAGTDGVDGRDGRGVESVSCTSPIPASWTFTYSDGTTQTVTCTATPTDPDPDPAEQPAP